MKFRFKFDSNDSLLRRTVITTGALVGACVAVVGSLTAIALLVTSHALGPSSKDSSATPSTDTPSPAQPAKRSAARTPT